jgi:hypothetical protein
MSGASNLQFTWKRMAEEREETARSLGRIAIALFLVCNVLAFTTYSGHSRYAQLCHRLNGLSPSQASYLGREVVASLSAVRSECE